MEELKRKEGSKGQSKLSDEQFIILDEIIQKENLQTAKEVQDKIKKEFNIEYSIRQIERIMKKLDYSYTKPYKIYSKMPDDAEEHFKKNTQHLDLDNFIVVFLDQTYCQNQDNSQRIYHKKGTKNIKKQPTERISMNGVGVQSINGNSFISFLDNTKTFEMMKFMITITINNIQNQKLKLKLKNIINNEELLLDNILDTVNKEKNYNKLIITLKNLSKRSTTMKKLNQRLVKNPLNFKTKSKQYLKIFKKQHYYHFFQIT